MSIPKSLRERLLKQYGSCCPVCGAKDVPLEIAYRIPLAQGGKSDDIDNLMVLCPTCHVQMDQINTSQRNTEIQASIAKIDANLASLRREASVIKRYDGFLAAQMENATNELIEKFASNLENLYLGARGRNPALTSIKDLAKKHVYKI